MLDPDVLARWSEHWTEMRALIRAYDRLRVGFGYDLIYINIHFWLWDTKEVSL